MEQTSKDDALDLDAAIVKIVRRNAVKVPPYPAVALKVDELIRRGNYALDELTRLVASDQALAAGALRCANTSFYRRGEPVSALPEAIARIGAEQLASLALASGLGAESARTGLLASLRRSCWQRSLLAAVLSRDLASHRCLRTEEAFSCGLLHDFGELIAVASLEEILSHQKGVQPRPVEEWREMVSRYHVELGLVMAARWRLPTLITDAISLHHAEDLSGAEDRQLVEVVVASDRIIALASDRTHLSAEDLSAASFLQADECQLMATTLERVPPFIAALEAIGVVTGEATSLIAPAKQSEWKGPRKPDFQVVVRQGQQEARYEVVGIARYNLMVSGETRLAENALLEMTLLCQPEPFTCWGSAKLCWPEGGRFQVLLQPFGLDPAQQARWNELFEQAAPTA